MVAERHPLQVVQDGKHWGNAEGLRMSRLLRGRVLVQVEPEDGASKIIWAPEARDWGEKGVYQGKRPHFGRVIAMGPPARLPVCRDGSGGDEVPYGFGVGDRIMYVYAVALEKMRSFAGHLCIVAQEEVVGVVVDEASEPDMHPRAD
jgi:hypothetical protein